MPATTYKYPVTDFGGGFDEDVLVAAIKANSTITTALQGISTGGDGGDPEVREIRFAFADALATAEKTELDGDASPPGAGSVLGGHELPSALVLAKRAKNAVIDRRSRELIDRGFTHNTKKFSLSSSAQLSLIGAFASRADLTYPIKWNTRDDGGTASFADAPAFKEFFLAGLGEARSHLDSGTALKDSVRAATTVAEVDAVVDNR